jgi:redox-sensitive bicupin YhaK (pirin superfamily)
MTGLQLWVNLKASDKMCEPAYQEKTNNLLAKTSKNGIDVTIIAGQSLGVKSETVTRTPTMYLDFKMQQGAVLEQDVESGWNAYMYVLSGRVKVENTEVRANQAGVFEKNGTVFIISALEATRFVLLAGRPIGEKIVQYGPFVMNEDHEINQAMRDYSMGVNGFEGSRTWRSRIASE